MVPPIPHFLLAKLPELVAELAPADVPLQSVLPVLFVASVEFVALVLVVNVRPNPCFAIS